MVRDTAALTEQVEHFDPLTAQQILQAQLIVGAHALDAADAADLLAMLGIFPGRINDDLLDELDK